MASPDAQDVISRDERNGNIGMSVLLTMVGVLWIVSANQLETRVQERYLTLAFVPLASGVFLTFVAVLLLIKYWRMASAPAAELGRAPLFPDRDTQLRIVATTVVLLIYIFLLPRIHYAVSTYLCVFAALALAGERIRPRLFVLSGVMSAVFFVVFVVLLDVALPGSRFG